jgi:hypothetical protein
MTHGDGSGKSEFKELWSIGREDRYGLHTHIEPGQHGMRIPAGTTYEKRHAELRGGWG